MEARKQSGLAGRTEGRVYPMPAPTRFTARILGTLAVVIGIFGGICVLPAQHKHPHSMSLLFLIVIVFGVVAVGVVVWMFSLQYIKVFHDKIEKHGMTGTIILMKNKIARYEANLTEDHRVAGKYFLYELMLKSGKWIHFRIDQFSRDQVLSDWFSDIATLTVRSGDW
jgi:hypothetical protein